MLWRLAAVGRVGESRVWVRARGERGQPEGNLGLESNVRLGLHALQHLGSVDVRLRVLCDTSGRNIIGHSGK